MIETNLDNAKREISFRSIQDWHAQLDTNDLQASIKAFYATLCDCNQATLSYKERFAIQSLLTPTLNYLLQELKKNYAEKEVLSKNDILIADLANVLSWEMLRGYKMVVLSIVKRFFYSRKVILATFAEIFNLCSKIILNAYEQHRKPFPGIWLEFHQFYFLANHKRLLNVSLKKRAINTIRLDTLEHFYKHFLLFSICNPNQLSKKHIDLLFYANESWAPLLKITKENKKNNHFFVLDPHLDMGPKPIHLYNEINEELYFLDLEKIIKRLKLLQITLGSNHAQTSNSVFNTAELSLPEPLIESLLDAWANIKQRLQERTKTQGNAQACLGLTAAYTLLNQDKGSLISPQDSLEDHEYIDLGNIPLPATESNSSENKFKIYHCELIDESAGGYCLKWLDELPPQLQCGEIIAINTPHSNPKWIIGTIRWLKTEEDLSVSLGIQIRSNACAGVSARFFDATTQQGIPTILLGENDATQKPMTLITPLLPFKAGNEVELEYQGQMYPVVLEKSYSQSSLYHEFGLIFMGHKIDLVNPLHYPKITTAPDQPQQFQ